MIDRRSPVACELRGIAKAFTLRDRKTVALDAVTLSLVRGQTLGLVGPSGCGKSTLLRIIAGLTRPDAGEVRWTADDRQHSCGLVFQNLALFPWLTVRGNISFGLRRFGGRREVTRRVQHYIERFGLSGFDRSYPAELSGGMQQRVALARTLITEPRMLLLDEPFASLDGYTRAEMQEFLLDVLRTEPRTTTVLVTHDVREAVFVSDRVAVMVPRPGRISAILDIPDPAVPGRTREWTYGGDFNELIATVEHQSLDARAEGSTEPGVKPPAGSQPVRSSTKV